MVYKVSVTFTTNQPINSLTIKKDSFSETIYSPFGNIINIPGSDISTNAYRFTFEGEDTAYSASLIQIPGSEWDAGESVYLSAYKYKPTNIPTIANTGTLTPKNYVSPVSELYIANTTYQNCQNIISVDLHNIPWVNNSMSNAFNRCTNLKSVTNINKNVTNMYYTFEDCYKLVNVPVIPNSVTDMYGTFRHCYAMVTSPTLPNSITSLFGTYFECKKLVNMPVIPNSVINMGAAFRYCHALTEVSTIPNSVASLYLTFGQSQRLTTANNIPASVTNMVWTFWDCTNLTGNIYIHSNQIANAYQCFNGTSLIKNVYIPFTYDNGVNTKTYNAFITAGYKIDGSVNGVYLKDINNNYFTLSVNPTPSDATVTLTQG